MNLKKKWSEKQYDIYTTNYQLALTGVLGCCESGKPVTFDWIRVELA